ncbi:MAG: transporter substrate-binding domain-containing protein [Clostridia bacterium]|nr:transporter substrate-binding domain-containing protein [Clostridia bacterium]
MKKITAILMTIAMLATIIFSVSADEVAKKETIKVAISTDFAPFAYYENGELKGFDVDLMRYIGERIGYDIEFTDMSFDALMPSVVNGEVDCAVSAITVTEERESIIDFSREYLKTQTITFDENGNRSVKYGEQYAVVFKEGLADSLYEQAEELTEDQNLYRLVDTALKELSNDGTVTKLIEKYELNKPLNESEVNIEYSAILSGGDPGAKAEDTETDTSATSVPCSEWAKEAVQRASTLNITDIGKNYNYPAPITRESFCELIYNFVNIIADVTYDTENVPFSDTKNPAISMLYAMGFVEGKGEGFFAPQDYLTREEAATILFRLIDEMHPDWAANEVYYAFADNAEISEWAMPSIQRICNMNIMQGVGDNYFAPQQPYTTEQAITTIVRVYDGFNKVIPTNFSDKMNREMPDDKNYMFSPLSVKMALAMAANGASGETKEQILNTLGIDDLGNFNKLSADLIARYSQTDALCLNIANSIWINKDKTSQSFSEGFKQTATGFYNAEVKSVNNGNAVQEINGWVSDKTNQKIPSIIRNADDFWAMLINAIYFKGLWENEFSERATKPDVFYSADGKESTIDFMNKTNWFWYAKNNGAHILELPYKNRVEQFNEKGEFLGVERFNDLDVSMYLIMADKDICVAQTLSDVIEREAFENTYVQMSMPKFKIEYDTNLNEMLLNMGIITAFDEQKADFTNMFDNGNMWFTKTIHKTFINVDEKGTEAAAVTAIGMEGTGLPPKPIVLKFNKPFYFVIRDNTSGETLFMGRFAYAE